MLRSFTNFLSVSKDTRDNEAQGKFHFQTDSIQFLNLVREWKEIVGPVLSKNTMPLRIQGKSLLIISKHPNYSQELSFMSEILKKKIFDKFPRLKNQIEQFYFKNSASFFQTLISFEPTEIIQQKVLGAEEVAPKLNRFSPLFIECKRRYQKELEGMDDEEQELFISLALQLLNKKS